MDEEKQLPVEEALLVYSPQYKEQAKALSAEYRTVCRFELTELGHFLEAAAPDTVQAPHAVVLSDDQEFSEIFAAMLQRNVSLGILPTPENSQLCKLFDIPRDTDKAMELALASEHTAIDQLTCNGVPVIYRLSIGSVPFASLARSDTPPSLLKRSKIFMRNLRNLIPHSVTITTAKEETFKSVVTGISVIEHDISRLALRLSEKTFSTQDGKLTAILVAPDSVLSYLGLLMRSFSIRRSSSQKLPPGIGLIKSGSLTVTFNSPLRAWRDGKHFSDSHFELLLHERKILINTGENYNSSQMSQVAEKDTLKLDNIPRQESHLSATREKLPLFSHAPEESFQTLFTQLRHNASLKFSYLVLMFVSAVIASLGLLLNSASVVIGAMILAPLMSPIVSFSMGLLRNDEWMTIASLKSIGGGIAVALAVSAGIAFMMPTERLTVEILARTSPNLLDLAIAVFAGIAAAYAHSNENITEALPGVAIAVALVPPLCVSGIGLGWWNITVFQYAFLLFLTNLAGITLAALLTFLLLGYSPLARAKRGIIITSLLSVAVAIPLFLAFSHMTNMIRIEQRLSSQTYTVEGKPVRLEAAVVSKKDERLYIHADIVSSDSLDMTDIKSLAETIGSDLNEKIILNVQPRLELR